MKYSERKKFKSKAHHLKPVIKIGKLGLTEALIKAADKALLDHELIKVKFIDFKEEKRELADEIAKKTKSEIIDIIGNMLILYRENVEE
jgi:RNA-binding protein